MTDFIFMLTRQDRTIAEAAGPCATALACGVRHIGFKDIGLPFAALRGLAAQIRAGGATSYLEVVSRDPESERRSLEAARALGVDVVMGGTGVAAAAALLAGSGIAPGRAAASPWSSPPAMTPATPAWPRRSAPRWPPWPKLSR